MRIGHYFPRRWFPIADGSHARHAQTGQLFAELGHEVINLSNRNDIRDWSNNDVRQFRNAVGPLYLFNTPEALQTILKQQKIDLLVVAYIDDGAQYNVTSLDIRKILEIHDIAGFNLAHKTILAQRLADKDFELSPIKEEMLEWEIAEYKRYDHLITISKADSKIFTDMGISNVYVPYTAPIKRLKNTYEDFPIIINSNNVINQYGMKWFQEKWWSRFSSRMPDFRINVVGAICDSLDDDILWKPYDWVEDMDQLLRISRFGLCPMPHGTGQKIKVLDMMAAALPVVAWKTGATESPLNSESGLLSDDIDELIDMCKQLWLNRTKCRQMGEIAKEQAASWFPLEKQLETLSKIL